MKIPIMSDNGQSRKKFEFMDIQTRKIAFVQEFLKLQNEDLISRFEKLLRTEKSSKKDNDFQPTEY